MSSPSPPIQTETRDSLISCRNSQGIEIRASLLRLARYSVVFEVYNPYSILQLSEVLNDFRIFIADRMVYSGRAIVSNMVNTGLIVVCECTLEESWLDVDIFAPVNRHDRLGKEFLAFLSEWEKTNRVSPEFKVVIADLQTLLMDLQRWFEQLELGVRSQPTGNRIEIERDIIASLQNSILPTVVPLFDQFETVARQSESEDLHSFNRTYAKRQLHPLVLCSPFFFRSFQKPLGYAGDYEMVNMMLRDPYEGSSMFAKMLNAVFLETPVVRAHRNRIQILFDRFVQETKRVAAQSRMARILNLGCGPAREIFDFLAYDLSNQSHFTLLDFNEETLEHVGSLLNDEITKQHRTTEVSVIKKSVHQILKAVANPTGEFGPAKYDFIYCAGLFDYFSDRICRRLVAIFYDMLVPGRSTHRDQRQWH